MTKRIVPFLFTALIVVASCSESQPEVENGVDLSDSAEETPEIVIADKYVDLDVDGMVCKMGCGGSIRKELKSTGAIEKVEFDFSEERETNYAKVFFDSKKIQVDEIVKIVAEINNGQFTVSAKQTGMIEVGNSEGAQTSASEEVKVNTYSPSIEMPNLFDLLSSLL